MFRKLSIFFALSLITAGIYLWGLSDGQKGVSSGVLEKAFAAESPTNSSPVKASARDFYAPNSEDLGPDEMRLIACGTGMPNTMWA
ncbi:MAG: hypothetical protein QNK32_05915 [Porticoccus sp.]|nr:hypothetical protein [Porticoccus sp.]